MPAQFQRLTIAFTIGLLTFQAPLTAFAVDAADKDAPFLTTSHASHQVRLLEAGNSDLELRLRMIENAQDSVDIETYEFDTEVVGRALLQALAKRSRELKAEGKTLKARFLVDYGAYDGDVHVDKSLAQYMHENGVEIRYFNRAPDTWIQKDYRSHRKVFVVDGKEAVLGGRNLTDAYFGLDPHVNFVDRDVWVKGPIAQTADATFENFWNSPYASNPGQPSAKDYLPPSPPDHLSLPDELLGSSAPNPRQLAAAEKELGLHEKAAHAVLADDPNLDATLADVRSRGSKELDSSPVIEADNISLISDRPGRFGNSHIISDYFHQRMTAAHQSVLLENYTLIPTRSQRAVNQELLDRSAKVELITNGSKSFNDWMDTWELSMPRQLKEIRSGMKVYAYTGQEPDYQNATDRAPVSHDWVVHSKVMIVDKKDTWIGTNNMDPRSENINSELAIVINNNPQFAEATEAGLRKDIQKSDPVTADGNYREQTINEKGCAVERLIKAAAPADKTFQDTLNHDWLRIRNEIMVGQY
jgi:cardiolipin synthase C